MSTASSDVVSKLTVSASTDAFQVDCARALRALCLGLDDSGRMTQSQARPLLNALRCASPSTVAALLQRPETFLGDFASLPPASQSAIIQAIADREAWQLAGYRLGRWHFALVRLLFELRNQVHAMTADSSLLGQLTDAAALIARRAPADILHRSSAALSAIRGRYAPRPTLSALLSAAGVDPRPLAVCYARSQLQRDEYRGYWHDPAAHRAVGMVIGIDFLPTDKGYLYVESNCTFGQKGLAELHDPDPMVENILDFTVDQGFRHLVLLDGNSDGVTPLTASRYRQGAQRRGIGLTLVDRENVAGSKNLRSHGIPRIVSRDTLILRTKGYPSSLDYIARIKSASLRALELYDQAHPGSGLLLPTSGAEPVFGDVDANEPFPNIIYKLPELDQGRGVIFMKSHSASHARELIAQSIRANVSGSLQARLQAMVDRSGGFYQAYYKSTMNAERRLRKLRAHVLISPRGVRFVSAHYVVACRDVPTTLPFGVVHDARPYLVNQAGGGSLEVVPQSAIPDVEQASVAVGRALAWAFDYGFRTCADTASSH